MVAAARVVVGTFMNGHGMNDSGMKDNALRSCAPAQTGVAVQLNSDCQCITVDRARLTTALGLSGDPLALAGLLTTHPHLFADSAVFVAPEQLVCMARTIAAIEQVVALPAWQAMALGRAGAHAQVATAARGMFLGYDFHLGATGPQLIEINTNAGGALLNVALRAAQIACCSEVEQALLAEVSGAGGTTALLGMVAMFREEWRLARGEQPLGVVAIVDDEPVAQYLYPEFDRFVALLAAHGITACIVDAATLFVRDGALFSGTQRIDFVYNRLTDFALDESRHAALAQAWREDLAVVSPHPRAHALYADKRNLVTLTDAVALSVLGVNADTIAVLQAGIPHTVRVSADNAAALWLARKQWFFKPAAGYGSKAAYRGDKLTRGKWQEILAAGHDGGYVAQALVPPSERQLLVDGQPKALKIDIRNYVYDGRVQLVSARLYQGQTTNFRTPGGGFAAVFAVPG